MMTCPLLSSGSRSRRWWGGAYLEVFWVLLLVGVLAGDQVLRLLAQVLELLQRARQRLLGSGGAASALVVGTRHLYGKVLLARLQEVLQVLALC